MTSNGPIEGPFLWVKLTLTGWHTKAFHKTFMKTTWTHTLVSRVESQPLDYIGISSCTEGDVRLLSHQAEALIFLSTVYLLCMFFMSLLGMIPSTRTCRSAILDECLGPAYRIHVGNKHFIVVKENKSSRSNLCGTACWKIAAISF